MKRNQETITKNGDGFGNLGLQAQFAKHTHV